MFVLMLVIFLFAGVALLGAGFIFSESDFGLGVCIALVGALVIVASIATGINRRSDDSDREVKKCLESGGIPDRSGRYDVHCYHLKP